MGCPDPLVPLKATDNRFGGDLSAQIVPVRIEVLVEPLLILVFNPPPAELGFQINDFYACFGQGQKIAFVGHSNRHSGRGLGRDHVRINHDLVGDGDIDQINTVLAEESIHRNDGIQRRTLAVADIEVVDTDCRQFGVQEAKEVLRSGAIAAKRCSKRLEIFAPAIEIAVPILLKLVEELLSHCVNRCLTGIAFSA